MNVHGKINYIEFQAANISATKQFFKSAFDWVFEDYGPDYTAFSGAGIDGGFFRSDKCCSSNQGAALIIFYSDNLESTLHQVVASGGTINKPVYSFPGGRRFHFLEPSGNELAVWSDIN